jgi:tRNA (cytidine/uridine-2'-O-)-methyltransferase
MPEMRPFMPTLLPALALYQPDIADNTAAMMRLSACLGTAMHVIEPCGFVWDEARIRRVAMDYIDHVQITRHINFDQFLSSTHPRRHVLLTTKASAPYTEFAFRADDILMVGRESAGVPDEVHHCITARVLIPMAGAVRSMNVAMAAAIAMSEAIRQTKTTDQN